MPKKVDREQDRKVAVPVSLSQRHIDFIMDMGSGSVSKKVRLIIDTYMERHAELVRFDKTAVELDDATPVYVKAGAFLVFQRTAGTRELDETAAEIFGLKAGMKPEAIVEAVKKVGGYDCQIVEYPELGFVSVWACKAGTGGRCGDCLADIRARVLAALVLAAGEGK